MATYGLKRLFLYRICLIRMKRMGMKRVFSHNLGVEAGVTAAQVRKDFSGFKIRGSQRGGYDIEGLLQSIEAIIHQNEMVNIVLVGMGNIGEALARYNWQNQRNINIVATFDIDPLKQRRRSEIPVYPVERLNEIVDRFGVRVAIMAIPEISAQEVCNQLVEAGIRGIVNFAPVLLKVPEDIVVNNINLYDEVESLFFRIDNQVK